MTRRTRRGVLGALAVALALTPAAAADPNVLPIAGAGSDALSNGIPATSALFADSSPEGVAVFRDYDFFYRDYAIVDDGDCKVRKVAFPDSLAGDVGNISTIVGTGCSNTDGGSADGTQDGTSYQLGYPTGISSTVDQGLLIADSGGGRVDKWLAGKVTTIAGTGGFPPNCSTAPADGSDAKQATFCDVVRVSAHPWDPDKFLVVDAGQTDQQGTVTFPGRVYEVYADSGVTSGHAIKTVAGGCDQSNGAPAALAVCFKSPLGVLYTGNDDNEFLITDSVGNQVFRFVDNNTAVAQVLAGTGQTTASDGSNFGDGGLAVNATFAQPSDLALSGDGGVFVADTYNCSVRKITDLDPATAQIYAIAGSCGDSAHPDLVTKSAYNANIYPFGLADSPSGLYIADPQTKQVQLLDRTTITSGPPQFTNATTATFQYETLEYHDSPSYTCKWDDVQQSCDAGPSSFSQGQHTFSVAANDYPPFQQADLTPATWTWTVDTTAPTGLALTSPDDGAKGLSPTPTFTWQAADGAISGIDHYELYIDGAKVAASISCDATSCSATAPTALSEADHTWFVKAIDKAGNVATTDPRKFGSGSPPTAAFTIAPNPVLAGRTVTFDGAASSDANGPIKHYEWDLDGDGTFETDTGTTAQVTKTYSTAGSVKVQLRVTDGVGLTNVAANTLTVTAPTLGNQVGVTINNGAQFTNDPNVTLTVAAPASATDLLVSNDGGFLAAKTFAVAKTVPWVLDSSGPERLPKTVYLRFLFGTFASPNYTDDIILDQTPPVVQQATVAPAPASASAARAAALKTWSIRVKASDSNSGVGGIQVTANKKQPGKLLAYKRKLKVKSATRPRFLRAKDRAGNFSPWKKLR